MSGFRSPETASTQISDSVFGSMRHVRDEASIARPALRKQCLGRGSEQAFPVAGRANPLQVQVRRRVPRRREHEGAPRPATRQASIRSPAPNVALVAVPRAASRSQIPGVASNRSTAACCPSCERATFMYPAGRSQRARRSAVALKPRRLGDARGPSPIRQRTARRYGEARRPSPPSRSLPPRESARRSARSGSDRAAGP